MIGKLFGFVDEIKDEYIILNVNDVGYLIYCSLKTISQIGDKKDKIELYIETVVREDSITLFGFVSELEKEVFNTLCKVSGVGVKMAIKILSFLSAEEVIFSIANKDKDSFIKISTVGDKIAVRIITELAKCSLVKNIDNLNIRMESNDNVSMDENKSNIKKVNDTITALENLGYQRKQVLDLVKTIDKEKPHLTLESLITETLKNINGF